MAQEIYRPTPVNLKRFKPSNRCMACRYSISHKTFHQDLLNSSYFEADGLETIGDVMRRYKVQRTIGYRNIMNHVTKHIAPVKVFNDQKVAELAEQKQVISDKEIAQSIALPDAETEYERALDTTILKFHEQLKTGKLKLTVNTGLQAIKIKADMEAKNRDRKLDFLKAFSNMGQASGED